MKFKSKLKNILSATLAISMIIGTMPVMNVFAAQSNEYVDPADSWLSANNRTNELDVNATITNETQYCHVCNKETSVLTYRVPEYTKSGETALNRGVKFSDGTCIDGKSKGNLDDGTPGVDAYYTSYHWTKVVCQTCGTINVADGQLDYNFNNNVYSLNPCDHNFFLDFDNTTYEPYNLTYHTTTLKKGQYCKFCKGTEARATEKREYHDFTEHIDAQLGNNRFYISEKCDDCNYTTSEYVTAKSVVTSYYGNADGEAHSVTVSDLSDSDVHTSIRYGTSADSCTKTSAPSYTKAGYYPIYYKISYKYGGETMTENGVSYVWLLEENTNDNSNGTIIVLPEKHEHDFRYLETVAPSCENLGYERWQCDGCGSLEKRNYTKATGHDYDDITIREATCKQGGLILTLCKNCGDFHQTTTATGEHKYKTEKHNPTCRNVGYTDHICEICGTSYITDMTPIISHSYERITKEPTCEDKGYTTSTCTMCGISNVSDYTEPTGHKWDNGETVTNSTCTSEGVIEYHCQNDNCKEKMIKAENAKGHTPGKAATCTEPQICEVCETVLEIPTGHHYLENVIEPTCTAMGYTEYVCDDCEDSYVGDYTDKAEHDYKETVTKPTCTSHGYTTYSCKNCDSEYVSDYTDKLSHNYNTVVTAPTCTSMGFTTYTCKDCGDAHIGDYTDMTEHNYNKQVIEPTCTEHGYTVYTCPDCGKEYIGDYTEHKNHSYTETVVNPTCTEMGYTIYSCTCGESYKDNYKNALGHKPSEWIIDTPATIEHSGSKHIECTECKEVLQTAELAQLIDTDRTDEDGKAEIGKYFVLLTDKDNKPIFNSEITIDKADNISIILPTGRLLDFADRTTVTVIDTENKSAAEGLNIFVADSNGNNATGVTDKNGQFIAPDKKSSTGNDNGTIGKEDNDKKFTYVVKVTDKLNVTIPNCDTYIGESNNVVVKLPDGLILTQESPAIITITDQNGNAQKGVSVIVIADKDYIEKGVTDMYGKLTVPPVNSGYTDIDGKVNVQEYYVFVKDETKNIENALVTLNEDNTFSVKLPAESMIDYANRITVTVLDKDGKAVKGIGVTVTDNNENTESGITNESGQVIVPPSNFDYTDINGYSEVDGYIVTVKNETAPIEKAYIKHNAEVKNDDGTVKEAENISVELPENIKFDYANRITVTVAKKADNSAVKDMVINISEFAVENVETKSLTDKTDKNGIAVFPPLSEDITDNDGNSNIKDDKTDDNGETAETIYNVLVEDTKGKIENAFIEVKDGKISVKLPDTHTLTTSNQTTVTVTDKDNKPMANVSVTITDATTSKTGTTNSNGKVTLPVKSTGGGGGSSRPSGGSSGGGGGSYIGNTVNVKVIDKNGKTVSVSKSNGTDKVTLTLPNGKNLLKDDNYYTITVTDRSNKAKADYTVVLKDKNGNEVKGTTDKNGVVTLPGKTHSAYIFGYDDGTFRPNSNMTRAEAAAIFARLVSEQKDETIKGTSTFTDVKSGEWYAKYVSYLEKYGIIKGYNDNTFHPDESVTRAEFVAMAVRFNALFNEVEKKNYTVNYTDLAKSYWAYNDIAFAKNIGWLNGYADGTFKGDNAITRAEVVTVVNRATGRNADSNYVNKNYTNLNRFTDVTDSNMWYFFDITEAANTHIGVAHTDGETWVK